MVRFEEEIPKKSLESLSIKYDAYTMFRLIIYETALSYDRPRPAKKQDLSSFSSEQRRNTAIKAVYYKLKCLLCE